MMKVVMLSLVFASPFLLYRLLRGELSNVYLRAMVSYLFTGFLFCAIPLANMIPATNALGILWLTFTWPTWIIFNWAPASIIPYLFSF